MEKRFYQQGKNNLDLLNDETFGVGDDVSDLNDDWEKQHEQFSKLVENERVVKSSPLRINQKGGYSKYNNLSDDEEEVIIESSISQLGLDDDGEESTSRHSSSAHSYDLKESRDSWMSPSRIHDTQTDSLKDLMSPGDGVWSSPSRGLLHDGDQIVPELHRRNKVEEENIIKKLFGGHNLKTAKGAVESVPLKPISVEDLERGLRKDSDSVGPPPFIERHGSPMQAPPPGFSSPGFSAQGFSAQGFSSPGISAPPGFIAPHSFPQAMPPDLTRIPLPSMGVNPLPNIGFNPLLMMNPHMRMPIPVNSPMGMNMQHRMMGHQNLPRSPFIRTPGSEHQQYQQGNQRGRGGRGRYNSPHYNNNTRWNGQDRDYNRGNRNYNRGDRENKWSRNTEQPEPLIEMEPSKMMTSKEKEWIFKISMMSLLSGDFMASDYYFINYLKRQALKQSSPNKSEDKKNGNEDEKEKAKNLVNYAQKHQQTKENHKPVKFEGSLGKLSITSVHHPRQIMDFSTPENEATTASREETGRDKYIMYGTIEKMYDLLLAASDVSDKLNNMSPEEQQEAVAERKEKINNLFNKFKVQLHSSSETSDADHFIHILSICKARKLLIRSFDVFTQVQSESLLITIIHVLPALLKKDNRDQALLGLPDKVKLFLKKSEEQLKLRCLKMLRKINLKMLLTYQMSIRLLSVVLNSLADKNPERNIEWSYYFCEVPRTSIELSPQVFKKNQEDIQDLKTVLGASDLLIKID